MKDVVNKYTDYREFHETMLKTVDYVEETRDIIMITQHKPVITVGKMDMKRILMYIIIFLFTPCF